MPCFTSGAESGFHKCVLHSYYVIEQNSYPIFKEEWGADEELLLLQGAEMYGLGSWADIADHIGGARDKDEVRDHYIATYIDSTKFPLPDHSDPGNRTFAGISREEFQSKKKRRIEARREEAAKHTPSAPKTKPTASVPSCHEIQGYMPGRLEFETEFDNEAEMAVKDLFFDPGDGFNLSTGQVEPEVELKCTVMEIYNHKLTQRAQRKKVMFEHGLLDYRKNASNEKKRTKDERDLLNKPKPFARIMNKADFDDFTEGLLREHTLRQAVAQLQEWRRMGIQSLEAGQKFEVEKVQRVRGHLDTRELEVTERVLNLALQNEVLRNKLIPVDRLSHRYSSKATPPVETPPINPLTAPKFTPTSFAHDDSLSPMSPTPGGNNIKRNGLNGSAASLGLNGENSTDYHLLSQAEQQLCANLRIKARPYMCIKERLLSEAIKHGGVLKEKTARDICKVKNAHSLTSTMLRLTHLQTGSGPPKYTQNFQNPRLLCSCWMDWQGLRWRLPIITRFDWLFSFSLSRSVHLRSSPPHHLPFVIGALCTARPLFPFY